MIGKKLLEQRDISLSRVRRILKKRKKDSELSYEQKSAYEYVKSFKKRKITPVEELIEKLQEVNRIDEHMAVMIADNQPRDEEDLKVLMAKKRHKLSSEESKKVLDLVAKYTS